MEELLTTDQVATRLDIQRRRVNRLVAAGKLVPEQKLPGRTGAHLFSAQAVDALAAEMART